MAEKEVRRLAARVNELERELNALLSEVPPKAPRQDSGPANRDARWHCKKCGYLLGFYDMQQDMLRTRYKEHIVFVRCGVGGFVQVICRGCCEVNTVSGDEAEPDEG